jgi:hypothetical protein
LSLTGQEISLPTTATPEFAELTLGQLVLTSAGAGADPSIRPLNNLANYSQTYFYPNEGTNTNCSFGVVPKGTGVANNLTQFSVFGTDYFADSSNYEFVSCRARGTSFAFFTGKSGTGTTRPLILSGDALATNQFVLGTNGSVGIGISTFTPEALLEVNGTIQTNSGGTTAVTLEKLVHTSSGSGGDISISFLSSDATTPLGRVRNSYNVTVASKWTTDIYGYSVVGLSTGSTPTLRLTATDSLVTATTAFRCNSSVRSDTIFNTNGTDGVTQAAAAGKVSDVTALAGGIATAQTQVTPVSDGAHSLAGITSVTTVNGRITAMA